MNNLFSITWKLIVVFLGVPAATSDHLNYPVDLSKADPLRSIVLLNNRSLPISKHLTNALTNMEETYSNIFYFYRFNTKKSCENGDVTILQDQTKLEENEINMLHTFDFYLQKESEYRVHIYLTNNVNEINAYLNNQHANALLLKKMTKACKIVGIDLKNFFASRERILFSSLMQLKRPKQKKLQ